MGFAAEKAKEALMKANWDEEAALNYLIGWLFIKWHQYLKS